MHPENPLVMFDFDGVVADSFGVFMEVFAGIRHEMGIRQFQTEAEILELFDGNPIFTLVRRGFPIWKLRKLAHRFAPQVEAASHRVQPFPGMAAAVSAVAACHPTYVVTSNNSTAVEAFNARHGITGIIEVIGSDKESSKVKKIKKLRRRHRHLMPVYLGDTKGDMIEARQAGAITVAAAWGWHPESTLLTAAPDYVLYSPSDVRAFFALD
jgi:phosphoglycolate phosphatase